MAARVGEASKVGGRSRRAASKALSTNLKSLNRDSNRPGGESTERVGMESDESTEDEQFVGPFLDLIDADIKKHPERVKPLNGALLDRAAELVNDIDVDLDMPLFARRRMTDPAAPVMANRWPIYRYPAFLDQIEKLVREVGWFKERDPDN